MRVNIFFNSEVPPAVRKKTQLFKRVVEQALIKLENAEINLVFVSAKKIKRLNKTYLGRSGVTDVIAFNHPPQKFSSDEPMPFGDIFICASQAKKQAKTFGNTLAQELLILCAHGALHLAGLDDKTKSQRQAMHKCATAIVSNV
ncbi:MAG: rRNA maturation RNase YbeY [Elusimicrobia bacterium]|nr:rRNA maturation RNase YbeY [Elusimicrobiota bacterium]